MRPLTWLKWAILASSLAAAACGPSGSGGGHEDATVDGGGPCEEGQTRCNQIGSAVERCQDGQWVPDIACTGNTPYCVQGSCVMCLPNQLYCSGVNVVQCNGSGDASSLVSSCAADETCAGGECFTQCELAATSDSNVGCEFWPTSLNNAPLDAAFDANFAVVVHNPNDQAVTLTVTKGGVQVNQVDVPAGEIQVITLDYDASLKGEPDNYASVQVSGGAYRMISTLPVTAYQFNPLSFELPEQCASGTEENTTVTIHFSAFTAAGNGIQSYRPGDIAQFVLGQGEVLQLLSDIPADCSAGTKAEDDCNGSGGADTCRYCNMGPLYDLTGTVIESTAPVAVYAGHVCSFVPFDTWACDHLEEQMIPSETWGSDYIVARTEPQSPGVPEPNVVKIVSREDDNTIDFDPPAVHTSVTLAKNEYVEISSLDSFRVRGTKPFMVAQFLVGQNAYTTDRDYWGDPAFALVVPFEQYRKDYTFLTPETMTYNYVNVIGPVGEQGTNIYNIALDGQAVDFPNELIGTYSIARIDISNATNSYHSITGEQPFGIMVYGFARFTSYFYPGGLNLEYINPVE